MKAPPLLIVYGDFNCPFSALASFRAAAVGSRGLARIDWRAVEHAPELPPEGLAVEGELAEAFERELDQVHGQLVAGEAFRLEVPQRQRNTRVVTEAYAAAHPADRPGLRERIFAAHWGPGATGEIEVASVVDDDARTEVRRWRAEWLATPRPIVPVMVLPDGHVSRGLGVLRRLADLSADDGSDRDEGGEDPCFAHLLDQPAVESRGGGGAQSGLV